jgi:hypothetical protein
LVGDDPATNVVDWEILSPDGPEKRHFLFYFRDETIEVIAKDWSFTRQMTGNG